MSNVLVAQDSLVDFDKYLKSFSLTLDRENMVYSISESIGKSDIWVLHEISQGTYTYSSGRYNLFDSVCNVLLTYKTDKGKLFPEKTYCYLKDIIWTSTFEDSSYYDISIDTNRISYQTTMRKRNDSLRLISQFEEYIYYDRYSHKLISIKFFQNKEKSYFITINGIFVSVGNWKKKLFTISIYDECLDHSFYFRKNHKFLGNNNFPETYFFNYFKKSD